MIEAIITFLDSATVKSFLAQYIATKVADTMFDKGSIEIHNLIKDNPEMQLLHVIEESIKTTCIKYNWDYQYIMSDRFAEETVNNQILVENDLRNLLSVTFGYDVSPQVVSFWMSSFFSLLSEEKNRKAKDYFNLYTNNRLIESTLQIEEQVRKINGIINQHVSEEYFHSVQQMSSLLKTIGMNSQRNYQLVESIPEVIETFVDREIELKSTFEQLKLHNCVFIGGMRGIGKTAFVQKYINKYRENYNCIVYFRCIEDLKSMIIDDSVITIRNLSRRIINNQKESDNEYFSRKIRVLREIVNEKVLFVIDGIELTDTALESITNIGAKFILITNNNVSNIPMTHMNIDSFCKKSDLLMLFKKYYFRNDINFQSKFLWEMFKKCQGHTLTIKLLALQMRANHKSPEEMYHLLEEKGLGNSMSDCIFLYENGFQKYQAAFEFIRPLFRLEKLDNDSVQLLEFLSLFQTEEIYVENVKKWMEQKNTREIINYLYQHGWVIYNEFTDMLSLHSIIQEVITFEKNVSVEKYSNSLNRILQEYTDFQLNAIDLNSRIYYGKIVKVLVKKVHSYEKLYPFIIKAERALSYAQFNDEAIDLANHINTWLTNNYPEEYYAIGRIKYCLGWTYATQLRDKKTGLKMMEEGLDIILKVEMPFSLEAKRQLSDIYGDVALVRARTIESDKKKAINEILLALDYFKQLNNESESYYARLSWLETFAVECYIKAGDYESAEHWVTQAMSHVLEGPGRESPYYMNVLYRKAQLLEVQENYNEAVKVAVIFQTDYLKYYPFVTTANLEHMVFISRLFYNNNDTLEAIEYIDGAIKIAEIIYGKGSCQVDTYIKRKELYCES